MPEVENVSDDLPPLTFAEAAARHRRTLADTTLPAADRIAALAAHRGDHQARPRRARRPSPASGGGAGTGPRERSRSASSSRIPTSELPLDKLRTSYSRIGTYDNCGLQYLLSVVLGLDPEASHNMAFGSWIHKIFEEIETGVDHQRSRHARARYKELFDETVFPNKAMARQFRRDGELMIERYIKHLKPGQGGGGRDRFQGRSRRAQDHRSHRPDRQERQEPHHHRLQDVELSDLLGRRAASRCSWRSITSPPKRTRRSPHSASRPRCNSSIPKPPLSRGDVQKRTQKPEEAEKVLERLPDLIKGVLAEDFRPNPEADCTWCKFKPLCPLWSEGKELPS